MLTIWWQGEGRFKKANELLLEYGHLIRALMIFLFFSFLFNNLYGGRSFFFLLDGLCLICVHGDPVIVPEFSSKTKKLEE